MLDANQIKVRLIDFLINNSQSELIASEVSFYQGYRKADLLQLSENIVTAYEIKSDKDNLISLSEQMEDYSNTFSFCYLVITEKHLINVRKVMPSKIGLMVVSNEGIKYVRKPKENKRLSKHSLALGLPSQKLVSITRDVDVSSIYDRRMYVEQSTPLESLKECFYKVLIDRYQQKYNNFLSDRGEKTSLSDLYYLQATY